MLYFARWKVWAILATAALVCAFITPNFFPEQVVKGWPAWTQRRLVLGLDLQGGSQILLEVDLSDVRKQRLDSLRDDVRGNSVEVRLREGADFPAALAKLRELSQPLGGVLQGNGQRTLEVVDAGGG